MKLLFPALTAICLAGIAQAGDLYRIGGTSALITARKADLIKVLSLATSDRKGKSFDLRQKLERSGGAFNLPNGTVVEVVKYFRGNNPDLGDIAKIVWSNGAHTGYVYKFELSRDRYVGSR
jgi:hypothetical protein